MENEQPERRRVVSSADGLGVFLLELETYPELEEEFHTLTGGTLGLIRMIAETIGNEVSYDPEEDMTPQRMRQIVGAPNDDSQLSAWREQFWDQYKARQNSDQQ